MPKNTARKFQVPKKIFEKLLMIMKSPVCPYLAKFRQFGTTLKHFGHFESVHLVCAKILSLFRQTYYAIGQIVIGVNVIWSCC